MDLAGGIERKGVDRAGGHLGHDGKSGDLHGHRGRPEVPRAKLPGSIVAKGPDRAVGAERDQEISANKKTILASQNGALRFSRT
jgi:hypothetical protein